MSTWLIGVNGNAEVLILTGKSSVLLVGLFKAILPQICPLCPLSEERGVRGCTTEPQIRMCPLCHPPFFSCFSYLGNLSPIKAEEFWVSFMIKEQCASSFYRNLFCFLLKWPLQIFLSLPYFPSVQFPCADFLHQTIH